jgi:PKD repeat protein
MKLNSLLRAARSLPVRLLATATLFAGAIHAQPASKVILPAPAHGAAAISALGAHLPDVARAYGLNPQQLMNQFRLQPSLGVDTHGALLFACAGLTISPTISAATSDETDAFLLHSLPGAPLVIYLDFTGHTTTGTNWNSAYTKGSPIISQPFSTDTDPTSYSLAELAFIRSVWKRVAEDFAPFSVDVTTQDPGIDGLRRIDSNDQYYGVRVVISPTNWYSTSAGGVGYLNSFKLSTDTPVFVFTAQLGTGEKAIAECSSHETGHSLGLHHDGLSGTTPTEYYKGQGNWAPIMGNSYSRAVTQWSIGEYANASNTADDTAIITTYLPVSDDHGNSPAAASALSGPNVSDGGTIETRLDTDVFRFDTGAGAISLSVSGAPLSPNLDVKAELLNSAGQVLSTSDSLSSLNASVTATVSAGTYFLRIDGTGNGDPKTTGYSDYASLGNYVITGTLVANGLKQAPVAIITSSAISGVAPLTVSFSGQNSTDGDGIISSYHWAFGTGDTASGVNTSYTYTSSNTYSATLTVTDNEGLVGSTNVTITVAAPANLAPIAVASANVTTGPAPLAINFSSTGSSDPDGQIAAYRWDFGDGTSATTASPAKTYSAPGNYVARLTVTDDRGATGTATVNVSVSSNTSFDSDVAAFTLSALAAKSGTTATASIVVLDRLSRPVSGATVTLLWSGVVNGTVSGQTDAAGKVSLNSPRSKKSGTATATITNVVPPAGRAYDATIFSAPTALNVVFN